MSENKKCSFCGKNEKEIGIIWISKFNKIEKEKKNETGTNG